MASESLSPACAPAKDSTHLASLMAALDAIEHAAGEIPGGSTSLGRVGLAPEAEIIGMRADTTTELLWKVRRISRAVENDWTEEAALPLVRSVEADLAAMQ